MGNKISITDFQEFASLFSKLGFSIPVGLALIPNNFDEVSSVDELLYPSEEPTIRVLWRNEGIEFSRVEPENFRIPQLGRKFDYYIIPTIFISYSILSQNPELVSIALGVISNYVTDFFKGMSRKPDVQFEIIVENGRKRYKRIKYKGSQEGMKDFATILDKVKLDE